MRNFFLLITIYALLQYAMNTVLISDDLYYDSFSNQIGFEEVSRLLELGRRWNWISYALIPVIILVKVSFVAICLSIGCLLAGRQSSFIRVLPVTVAGEYVFLIPGFTKLLWFSFFSTDFSLEDLQFFAPLSILSLFNPMEVERWLVYPLQVLNLFEFAYWCILALQLRDFLGREFWDSFGFVTSTYGIGLLLWVVFVMFVTVTLS